MRSSERMCKRAKDRNFAHEGSAQWCGCSLLGPIEFCYHSGHYSRGCCGEVQSHVI